MKQYRITFAVVFLIIQWGSGILMAEDTNTLELIKRLQQRIDELEQKVKSLEGNSQKQPTAPSEAAEKQRLDQLDQQLKALQRQRELDEEAAQARAKEAPKISIGDQGFSFGSANGNFGLRFGAVLQVDSRTFLDDGGTVGNDGFLLRRARPIMAGTVFRDFDFLFVPDFGTGNNGGNGGTTPTPQIFDAFVNYRYSPALQLQAGKFKSPIGLEQLQADRDILFNERALPTDLVPNRDVGFALHGDLFGGTISYSAGVFNGVGDARNSSNSDFEDQKAFEGRLFFLPFKKSSAAALQGIGFGLGGGFEKIQGTNTAALPATTGGTLPGFATVGQQQFFAYNPANAVVVATGQHWRLSPQAYYYYGPFGLLGEYVISDQQVSRLSLTNPATAYLRNTAWEVSGSWLLTGEDATYGPVIPLRNFNPREGGWGAWQVVARYSQLNVDHNAFPLFANPAASASAAHEWSVGLNWYLNRNVRFDLSYSQTRFDGGGGSGAAPPASVTRQDEKVIFTRVQLAF